MRALTASVGIILFLMTGCSSNGVLIRVNSDSLESHRIRDTVYSYLGNGKAVMELQLGLVPTALRLDSCSYDRLSREFALSGRIVDQQSGETIPSADVLLGSLEFSGNTVQVRSESTVKTDSQGRFAIRSTISQSSVLYIGALGYLVAGYRVGRLAR